MHRMKAKRVADIDAWTRWIKRLFLRTFGDGQAPSFGPTAAKLPPATY